MQNTLYLLQIVTKVQKNSKANCLPKKMNETFSYFCPNHLGFFTSFYYVRTLSFSTFLTEIKKELKAKLLLNDSFFAIKR